MKISITLALMILLSMACSKHDMRSTGNIVGKWELRESTGGFAGTLEYPPGNGNIAQFDNTGTYSFSWQGLPRRQGSYTISRIIGSTDWILNMNYIQNGQSLTERDSIRFDKNSVIFLPEASCCDIPTSRWESIP